MDNVSSDVPMKRCSNPECQQELPATQEYFRKSGKGLRNQCKNCMRRYQKNYRQTHAEEIRESNRKYVAANLEKVKEHARIYGKTYRQENAKIIKGRKRLYRQIHHEEILAKGKVYRDTNREAIRGRDRIYSRTHTEKIKTYKREYRLANLEKVKMQHKQYASEHTEHLREYRKIWQESHFHEMRMYRQLNAESINAHNRKRRAIKRRVGGTHTAAQVVEQLKRQHYRCYYAACGFSKFPKVNGKYQYHVEHTYPLSRVAGMGIPANDMSYLVLSCKKCNERKHDRFPWEFSEGGRLL